MVIASFISFSSFIVRVVSSANCFIFVVLVCKFSFLFSFTCMPLMSGLFLILIASISTAIINRSGLNGHPWRIPLSVGNQLDSQPPFWTQLCVASIAVWINFWKWDPKLKMSRASLMHLLDRVSKAFEKSRATSAPDLFFWLRYFAKSSNNLKCEAIFLPLTNPIWSSFTTVFITFCSLSASALVKIL